MSYPIAVNPKSVSYTHLRVDKEDYLLAMERSPIKDIEIKHLLKNALTDDVDSREVYICLLYTSRQSP